MRLFTATFLLLLIPTFMLTASSLQPPPAEFAESHPQTLSWAFGLSLMALVAAVTVIARMVSRNVDRALKRNEDEIRCIKADARALDTRVTILETQHRAQHGGASHE